MLTVLFADRIENWPAYEGALTAALAEAGLAARLVLPPVDPGSVDYIVYSPRGPVQDFTAYTRTKAVLSLWAGVERVVGNPTLTQPLCRMVDQGLERGMVEWVTGHVLRAHLNIDFFLSHQDGIWRQAGHVPPLAQDRSVVVLGLGALGGACATTLAALGFKVTGWSRTPKILPGITCLAGAEGLREALSRAEILVTVLPNTPETTDLLNATTLALLPRGAVILNPGRGTLIDDAALLAALETGQIGHATLDVFRVEPLPPEHPYWAHPKVTVTPHIAAETRPASAARGIAENIRRFEAGEVPLHLVDRARGY
ncbi:glyoxylate/hydroxypyruvate reductase A [Rhodobacter capsulatus]|uniref:2-hydroxyacid dehydrogenase n=1 Tax=Rhodobacter capsulatus TaxID=1061 RepID=UPI0006DC981A|nr:glyoxylate/hydroxypyruvate reductase A [Rhodobacter capsulatus]KQB11536.1 glyoxylate/hydroxypyruvate reductase A [Rhodobacter capsulatus]KQB12389.1 glyoxylate/hydroxypyruvate reductase A [Rhodobacter capsulatus]PZX25745.1 glyoxylate/hydroxypyruvate reductase A [Rhodobacter capsulatus]QNR64048.1 glyoxylate/hydroxypyruvate reductase A [Rhodobacter capsulatus]